MVWKTAGSAAVADTRNQPLPWERAYFGLEPGHDAWFFAGRFELPADPMSAAGGGSKVGRLADTR